VFYKRDGSVRVGTVIARTPDDKRVLASVPASDAAIITFLTDGRAEPVGSEGRISKGNNGLMIWSAA
jgi:acetyl-CoA C-acetyltransferase